MNKNDKKQHRPKKGLINPKMVTEWNVYKETTLMDFLIFKMGPSSRKTVKSLLSHHQVAVGGVPVSQFDYKIYPEDVVTVSKRRITKRERKDLPILFEDQDIIAIDKPSGLLSVATEREKGKTAYRMVSDYLTQKDKKSRAFVVHRLDEDTSGVLIFAKNIETREALQNHWQEIVTKRYYYAVVEGEMEKKEDTLRDYLAQDNFQLIYVTKIKTKGKLAITSYKTIKEKAGFSLLDVALDSGRKNQIRVQLGNIGHYIVGDDKYGEPADPLKRLGLHAYELAFTNPLNGKKYDIKSNMPVEFKKMFFEGNYNLKVLSKAVEAKQRKKMRDTRSETRIKKGKKRQEKTEHYFGQNTKRSKSASPKKNAYHKPRAKK